MDRLFRLYHRELQKIAYRRLGDRELAADLTQDTFLRYLGLHRAERTSATANPQFFHGNWYGEPRNYMLTLRAVF